MALTGQLAPYRCDKQPQAGRAQGWRGVARLVCTDLLWQGCAGVLHAGLPRSQVTGYWLRPYYLSSTPSCFMKNFMSSQTSFLASALRSR